jgi:hypothetical protein
MTRSGLPTTVVIRTLDAGDGVALARLAELDCKPAAAGPVVGAEVRGELRAAFAIESGTVAADPFHATAELVAMLEIYGRALRRGRLPPAAQVIPSACTSAAKQQFADGQRRGALVRAAQRG